jgi:hypothetical protein
MKFPRLLIPLMNSRSKPGTRVQHEAINIVQIKALYQSAAVFAVGERNN